MNTELLYLSNERGPSSQIGLVTFFCWEYVHTLNFINSTTDLLDSRIYFIKMRARRAQHVEGWLLGLVVCLQHN